MKSLLPAIALFLSASTSIATQVRGAGVVSDLVLISEMHAVGEAMLADLRKLGAAGPGKVEIDAIQSALSKVDFVPQKGPLYIEAEGTRKKVDAINESKSGKITIDTDVWQGLCAEVDKEMFIYHELREIAFGSGSDKGYYGPRRYLGRLLKHGCRTNLASVAMQIPRRPITSSPYCYGEFCRTIYYPTDPQPFRTLVRDKLQAILKLHPNVRGNLSVEVGGTRDFPVLMIGITGEYVQPHAAGMPYFTGRTAMNRLNISELDVGTAGLLLTTDGEVINKALEDVLAQLQKSGVFSEFSFQRVSSSVTQLKVGYPVWSLKPEFGGKN